MAPIRLLLADDHPVVINGLHMLLESVADFDVVGTVNNGLEALHFLTFNQVDVVLTDHHMPGLTGLEMASKARERGFSTRVIMLTMNEDVQCVADALQVGVTGYVIKSAEKPELIKAIRTVYAGDRYLSDRIQKKLAAPSGKQADGDAILLGDVAALTRREIEVLRLVTSDFSNAEISEKLFISVTTVETHRRNLMKKAGVSTAIGLMRWSIRHGLVDDL